MKQTVNFNTFDLAFIAIRPDNFTYEGRRVLFDYLEELDQEAQACGCEELELDVIALCCEYCESTPDEIIENYDVKVCGSRSLAKEKGATVYKNDLMAWLQDQTIVCGVTDSGTIVYSAL